MSDFKVKETEKIYHGSRIVVFRDFVEQPDGSQVTREVVAFSDAVAVVGLTHQGEVVLIKQFRYPVKGTIVEIPAGVLAEGEEPRECARRELREETGYQAGKLTHLGKVYTSPGVCTEAIDLFLAEEMEEGTPGLEHGEVIEPLLVKFEDALDMITGAEIADAKTICGLLLAKALLGARRET